MKLKSYRERFSNRQDADREDKRPNSSRSRFLFDFPEGGDHTRVCCPGSPGSVSGVSRRPEASHQRSLARGTRFARLGGWPFHGNADRLPSRRSEAMFYTSRKAGRSIPILETLEDR